MRLDRMTPSHVRRAVQIYMDMAWPSEGQTKPLFPARSQVKLDLPCLGSVPFDPDLAALCDRGGAPSDVPALVSGQPVQRIAEEICRRAAARATAPEEKA